MHAYMIIAHNQFELLEKLITALDDERNDIFVHIDAKVKDFEFGYFSSLCKYSRVVFTPERINVTWGDCSQIRTEMLLLKTAVENERKDEPYSCFHLLSGVDLPIKSNDEIHSFFEENSGKEFIHYTSDVVDDLAKVRLKYYHFFRRKRNTFYKVIAQIALKIQMFLGVNRIKNIAVQKGCNWFSITGKFAHYIVDNLPKYEKVFRFSYCGDEVFIQTIAENSEFKNNLFMPVCNNNHFACARLIDWNRGNPYVFRESDFNEIMASPCMFARKFDLNVDRAIIDLILNEIKK